MKNKKFSGYLATLLGFLFIVLGPANAQSQPSAEDIIRSMDSRQTFDTVSFKGKMIIVHKQLGTKTLEFQSYGQGQYDTLLQFTSGAERGQKILRTKDKLYLYSPRSEDIILLQGAALSQSLGGGDVSYEDMTSSKDTLADYDVKIEAEEQLDGKDTWKISLTAKRRRGIAYPIQQIWVEKGSYITWKMLYFSRNNTPMKEVEIKEVQKSGEQYIPTDIIIRDLLLNKGHTELVIDKIEINPKLPAGLFSLQELGF